MGSEFESLNSECLKLLFNIQLYVCVLGGTSVAPLKGSDTEWEWACTIVGYMLT